MYNQHFSTPSLESERQKFVFVLMVVMMKVPLIRRSSFGGHATILTKALKFSLLQRETVAQVTKTGWSSKMVVLHLPILICSYHLP